MTLSFSLLALAALLPSAVVPWRRHDGRDGLFYAMVALGVLGPAVWVAAQAGGVWRTGFAMSLWVSIAVTMALFLGLALVTRHAWQLGPLLLPYLSLLGLA